MFKQLLAFLLLLLFSSSVFAMSCAVPTFEESYAAADAVFLGRVTNVTYLGTSSTPYPGEKSLPLPSHEKSSWCGDKKAVFEIIQSWKGASKSPVTIWSGDGCLGLGNQFDKGKIYIVYALRKKDRLVTSFCDRTMEAAANEVKGDKAALDTMIAPVK